MYLGNDNIPTTPTTTATAATTTSTPTTTTTTTSTTTQGTVYNRLQPVYDEMSRLMQQVHDQVFDKKSRKHVANHHELVENLAANLVENQVCPSGLQLARMMECGLNQPTRPTQPLILTGSINRVPTCPVGWRQITLWSRWQVTSRSSKMHFTKNYTLLYLYLLTSLMIRNGIYFKLWLMNEWSMLLFDPQVLTGVTWTTVAAITNVSIFSITTSAVVKQVTL